jgi:NitT/TauT family transport system substrate-binding protein
MTKVQRSGRDGAIDNESRQGSSAPVSRRALLRVASVAGAVAPLGVLATRVFAGSAILPAPKSLKLTWNASAICTASVPVAISQGIFSKYYLNVELINFGGSTDQLLEAIATGKADAGVGMALRWLKPLEQGFDVRLTTGIHGGCMRLLASKSAGIDDLAGLRGKTIAVSDMAAPDKNFFSILLAKQGIDPNKDVEWRQYPADLLGLALQKGEAQALTGGDPIAYLLRKNYDFTEIASNLSGEYQQRVCCVLGVRGSLIRQDRATVTALTEALLEAGEWTANNPEQAAAAFGQYSTASVDDLSAMLRSHTHHHHPVGSDLKGEIARYADELKLVQVIKPSTDTGKFADRVYADVLS